MDQFQWMSYALTILEECENGDRFDLIEKVLQGMKPHYKDILSGMRLGFVATKEILLISS